MNFALFTRLGQEEFDRLRSLSYAETHVIMICFSVDNPVSLENVESKVLHYLYVHGMLLTNSSQWLDEILEYCPGVKVCSPCIPLLDNL